MNSGADERDGFQSPEDAAIAGWSTSPGADAHATSTEIIGDRAEVVIEVGTRPAYRYYEYFIRRDDRWYEAPSDNSPSERWWDPTFLRW